MVELIVRIIAVVIVAAFLLALGYLLGILRADALLRAVKEHLFYERRNSWQDANLKKAVEDYEAKHGEESK